jgi:hypothetical protein
MLKSSKVKAQSDTAKTSLTFEGRLFLRRKDKREILRRFRKIKGG